MIKLLIEADNGMSWKERLFWLIFSVISAPLAWFGGMKLWDIIHDCAFALDKF